MLKNYLVVALRTLRRHKGYTFLNVAGLGVGLACCLLIVLYVHDELRFDAFHTKADRIYRVVETRDDPEGARRFAQTAGPVGPALAETFPEVEHATRLIRLFRVAVGEGERRFYEGDYLFAEPSFFDVFDFPLLAGDSRTALSQPRSVVLTETAARKYFGDEAPYGKTLAVEALGEVNVTGVLRDPPPNSHLTFSMLFSSASLEAFEWWEAYTADWTPNQRAFLTYVVLGEGQEPGALAAKLPAFLARHQDDPGAAALHLTLQPLRDIHFHSAGIEADRNQHKGDIAYLYIFSAIALFLLLIACINYMNLATARSTTRAMEVGMRKTLGAHRGQLVGQFLTESVLLAALAVLGALALAQLLLPAFNDLTGKALALRGAGVWLGPGLALLALGIGIAAGSYPAFYLSHVRPIRALKGLQASGTGAARLRRGLVVTQFTLSIVLLTATVVVYQQLQYVRTKQLGFDKEHLVVIDINSGETRRAFEAVKAAFGQHPSVRSVAVSSRVPGDWKSIPYVAAAAEGVPDDAARTVHFIGVDEDFLTTYAIPLAAGRTFSRSLPTDTAAVLLNESAVRALGLDAPIGQRIRFPEVAASGADGAQATFQAEVIGVVEDFHFKSLYEPVGPLVLGHRNNPIDAIDYFSVRVQGEGLPATLAALRSVGERFDPEHPFEYHFLDEKLAEVYETDARVGRLFGIAAALAVLVACLGLFGLAAFTAAQRTKEIGVRKVLGASAGSIVALLSKDFARLVLLAFAAAVPVAYVAMDRWLDDFAYRTTLGPGAFTLAGLAALAVALLTVSYHALRAARANPTESLRSE